MQSTDTRRAVATILLAEDDPDMRAVLARSLTRAGYRVTTAPDGQTALDILNERQFDVLVTDVKMPGLDGVALVKHAIQIYPELRVIFITGFAGVSLWLGNSEEIAYPVVSKPFHLKGLEDEIARELQKRDTAREVSS